MRFIFIRLPTNVDFAIEECALQKNTFKKGQMSSININDDDNLFNHC